MSAVKEWFGGYNNLFRHIRETYGADELDRYIDYIADEANSDISEAMKNKPASEAAKWFTDNFTKDGADFSVAQTLGGAVMTMNRCAAYEYMDHVDNPYEKGEAYYCDCCKRLNTRICVNAGVRLDMTDIDRHGKCRWTFAREGK